jgi:hypothetical protein
MLTKIAIAFALAFAAVSTVSAAPFQDTRTCGYMFQQYDSSGATKGPYCH